MNRKACINERHWQNKMAAWQIVRSIYATTMIVQGLFYKLPMRTRGRQRREMSRTLREDHVLLVGGCYGDLIVTSCRKHVVVDQLPF